jgi:transcriptional regulator GlxA family with amidase domain
MKILWISDTLEPVELTTYAKLVPTTTFDTCPPLDLLLVPGPSLEYVPPPDLAQFLIKRAAETPVVMATCTGSFVLAGLGILDGKRATVNKELIDIVEKRFPKVNWVRDERWVVDGKFWTAGGATIGIDMAYAFLKSDKFSLGSLPERALAIIEYTARPQSYA